MVNMPSRHPPRTQGRSLQILVVDDDDETRNHVVAGLAAAGHNVSETTDGASAMARLDSTRFDAIVLDRQLRQRADATPVLMLTAVGDIDARVEGIEAGADDYLIKPFAFVELSARLMALQRRHSRTEAPAAVLQVADLVLAAVGRTVKRGGTSIALQPREFLLLEYLMRHCDQLVTRTMLLQDVWKYDFDPQTSIVETHISRLRSKVDRGFASGDLIETVRGEGYLLRGSPVSRPA
jgi:two-component system, OmpR family, response regulator